MFGRGGVAGQPAGLTSADGGAALEVTRLSIKSSAGEERMRLDPGGLTIFGDKEKREQVRLDFGGLRFFEAKGESAHFDSQELRFLETESGMRCSLDSRMLACADDQSGGLSATFGILAAPKGATAKQSEFYAKMTRTPQLSLTNLQQTTSIDLVMSPSPSISVSNQATGKTVIGSPELKTASGFRAAEASAITLVDKAGRIVWKAP